MIKPPKAITFLTAFIITSLVLVATLSAGEAPSPFTIILLPDTQNYLKYEGADKKFLAQTRWIKENKDKLNIKFVIHEGDITDDNSPEQWKKAKACMEILDGCVPYALCVGNHDIGYKGPAKSPVCEYFKESDLSKEKGWGGKMPEEDCFWYMFEAGSEKYVILSLGLGPNDKMLKWADGIVEANKDCHVLMVTHDYLDSDGRLSNKKTKKNATAYGAYPDGSLRNTGEQIWDKHVKKHGNYIMVFSGHYEGPASKKSMKGENGNIVHQMMANYQYQEGGGNGYLRILKFDQSQKKCQVSTYSPYLDKFWKDDANEFSLYFAD